MAVCIDVSLLVQIIDVPTFIEISLSTNLNPEIFIFSKENIGVGVGIVAREERQPALAPAPCGGGDGGGGGGGGGEEEEGALRRTRREALRHCSVRCAGSGARLAACRPSSESCGSRPSSYANSR